MFSSSREPERRLFFLSFFFNDTATTEIYTLSLHDALPIYTRDVRAIFRFVDKVDVGLAHVNQPTLGGEVHLPFGGVKASGIGPHEQGREAIDFFTKVKTVYINFA